MAITKITNSMVSVNAIQGTLIADNAITAVHIASNAVASIQIAENNVTARELAANTITVAQLADDCVEADKIADGVITTNHLNKTMVSSQTEVTPVAGDFVLLGDTSDSNNLKKAPLTLLLNSNVDLSTKLNLSGGTMTGNIAHASDFTLDIAASITLDSDSGVIDFDDGGTNIGRFENASSDFKMESRVQDKDIVLVGNDGGTGVEALRLDMSDAGKATFNSGATFGDYVVVSDSTRTNYFGQDGNGGLIGMSTNHYLKFITNNSERMRISSAGLIGIGDSPNNLTSDIVTITTPASGGGQGIAFKRLDSNSDQTVGQIRFSNNSTDDLAFIKVTTDGSATSSRMRFFTNTGSASTERMKILSDGEIVSGPAAINDTYSPLVNGLTSDALVVGRHSTSGSMGLWRTNTMEFKWYHNGQGYIMTFGSNGVLSGDFNDTSDVNLKENISSISDGTTVIKALRPVKFDWKASSKGNNQHGFLAQEVELVLPDAVEGNDYVENETGLPEDEPAGNGKNMNSNAVLAHAVKAIQELEARITALEG